MGDGHGDDLDPLDALAAEFVEALRSGQAVSVAQYAADHPQYADQIRELFPTIAAMERLKGLSDSGRPSLGGVRLERLGDFRIIREIGRGGMGIVFEAEQESLGRHVAIKVLPRQTLNGSRQLVRFTREARMAARLHHTNIVPVFGVGQHDDYHYYVMQFIRGLSLDKLIARLAKLRDGNAITSAPNADDTESRVLEHVLEEFSRASSTGHAAAAPTASSIGTGMPYWRWCANIMLQAARALHYAHTQDTLHRDIKPANILLDERGGVWVTDFGLARVLQADTATQSQDISGTPRYMAPEQFSGRADAQSDVYSLGLTLYELVLLQPAFPQTQREALLQQILHNSPPAPARLNQRIPRDLETIVLKATERDAKARYASAGDLAEDLQAFLDDRPIAARRIFLYQRMWRWCRRNRDLAAMAGAFLLSLGLLAGVSTIAYVQTRDALEGQAAQRKRAESVAVLAQEALDRIFEDMGPLRVTRPTQLAVQGSESTTIELPSQPAISREMAALLEKMLPFYDRLAAQTADDAALRQRSAEANCRVGDIRHRLGQYQSAAAAYERAIALYRDLAERAADKSALTLKIAAIYNEIGRLHRSTRDTALAQQAHQKALALLVPAMRMTSPAPEAVFELARTYYFVGCRLPLEPGAQPRGPRRGPGGGPPEHPGPPDRPGPRRPAEDINAPTPQERQAQQIALANAIDILQPLVKKYPAIPQYRHLLALCHRESASANFPRSRAAASESLDQAIALLEQLVRDFPQVADYRYDLCDTYAAAADPRDSDLPREEMPAIEQRLQKAAALAADLVAQHPHVPEYRASEAQLLHRYGAVLRQLRRHEESIQHDREAVSLQAAVAAELPDVATHKLALAAYRCSLADSLTPRGDMTEAKRLLSDNVTMLEALLKTRPDLWYVHGLLAETHHIFSMVYRRMGQDGLADAAQQESEKQRRMTATTRPYFNTKARSHEEE